MCIKVWPLYSSVQANTKRGMHIGNLSAGLDEFKQKLQHAKSGTSVDHMPEVSPVELPSQDDSVTMLHSELADLQKKQSSRSLQVGCCCCHCRR